jgi:uncharacterized damage-inducible protein DinB
VLASLRTIYAFHLVKILQPPPAKRIQSPMSQPIQPWFSRTFNFPYPTELLPNLMSRLRGTPARLEEVLRDRPAPQLTAKPNAKWSAQEHAGHLLDLESLWLARLDDFFNAAQLTRADLTNRTTDDANYNARRITDILSAFRAARVRLLIHADQLDLPSVTRTLTHPRLSAPMRTIDHLYFVAEHDDHHLAQIEQLVG